MKTASPIKSSIFNQDFVLGRERFEKFCAVEGIFLTAQEKLLFAEMDRNHLSHEERRSLILARFIAAV
jgi:hypothetical protein